jgi:hypothetical protein
MHAAGERFSRIGVEDLDFKFTAARCRLESR